MSDHALVKLSGLPDTAAAVGYEQIVENQQLPGFERDLILAVERQPAFAEERELVGQAAELQTTSKTRRALDAREHRLGARRRLNHPGKTPLEVSGVVVPRTVATSVSGEPFHELVSIRPLQAREQRRKLNQPRVGLARSRIGSNVST